MKEGLSDKIEWIRESLAFIVPELVISGGIFCLIVMRLFLRNESTSLHRNILLTTAFLVVCFATTAQVIHFTDITEPVKLFGGMLVSDSFTTWFKILFGLGAAFTLMLSYQRSVVEKHLAEYCSLVLAILLGAHLLVMSTNWVMVFLSVELISISSYVLAGFSFKKEGAEGSLKYFLFGSVASAVMLYGISLLYGLTGTLDFSTQAFTEGLIRHSSPLVFIAGLMALSGFLFKISAVPMHPWTPDIYEASPMPVVAFFSVVPKLAGVGILIKFVMVMNLFGEAVFDWQKVLSVIAIITITFGNFSALKQKSPKRLMAYSSIAQSGFLLAGVAAFLPQALHVVLFYATVYLIMNFLVFACLQYFETRGVTTLEQFSGTGKYFLIPVIFLLIGFVALTGLPPTAGFTAKLLIFSVIWESYVATDKTIILGLFIFGLTNTIVSLFYYLRIPYFAFFKTAAHDGMKNNLTFSNLFAFIMVLLVLLLFFQPHLLMGWINRINFVL